MAIPILSIPKKKWDHCNECEAFSKKTKETILDETFVGRSAISKFCTADVNVQTKSDLILELTFGLFCQLNSVSFRMAFIQVS